MVILEFATFAGEMSIEDVIKKYRGAYESDFDMSVSQSEGSISTSESEEG